MRLLIFALFLGISNAFRLPKIFKSGMVLQAEPTFAVIWGFLDGNMNPVDVYGECSIEEKKFAFTKTYIPKEVIVGYTVIGTSVLTKLLLYTKRPNFTMLFYYIKS